jgi:uncharacterized protein DUF4157
VKTCFSYARKAEKAFENESIETLSTMNIAVAHPRSVKLATAHSSRVVRPPTPGVSSHPFAIPAVARCACGGSCPRCKREHENNSGLTMTQPGDSYERQAESVAAEVMNGGARLFANKVPSSKLQRSTRGGVTPPRTVASLGLGSPSRRLDDLTREFMEERFDWDFGHVRLHTDHRAAESAGRMDARAYTVGDHVVFGAGEYAPSSSAGRKLIAHELAHVIQQSSGALGSGHVIQRQPTISILDEDFIGPASPTERRAAKSCPINCCTQVLGTLQALPIFSHRSREAIVAPGSAEATGIGAALHFISSSLQPPMGELCHCDDFKIIQVLETNNPAPGRGGNSYVDNDGRSTPFYSDVFLHGFGEHSIPGGYPDAGERLSTTASIYDRPSRDPTRLPAANLSWMAESCVACIKNDAPDRILGCVTYGFTRTYNAAAHSFFPVVPVAPACRTEPSQHFVDTLSHDPTTSDYPFQPPPGFIECGGPGDFPRPSGDTRVA